MDNTMIPELRKILREFILADERRIILQRPTFAETATGGYVKGNFVAQPEQSFRMVPYKRRLTDLVKMKDEGEIPNIPYILVGFWNCNLQRMDEFFLEGAYYRVQALEPHTGDGQNLDARAHTDRVVAQLVGLDRENVTWQA